jgi:hypothetical protein
MLHDGNSVQLAGIDFESHQIVTYFCKTKAGKTRSDFVDQADENFVLSSSVPTKVVTPTLTLTLTPTYSLSPSLSPSLSSSLSP